MSQSEIFVIDDESPFSVGVFHSFWLNKIDLGRTKISGNVAPMKIIGTKIIIYADLELNHYYISPSRTVSKIPRICLIVQSVGWNFTELVGNKFISGKRNQHSSSLGNYYLAFILNNFIPKSQCPNEISWIFGIVDAKLDSKMSFHSFFEMRFATGIVESVDETMRSHLLLHPIVKRIVVVVLVITQIVWRPQFKTRR